MTPPTSRDPSTPFNPPADSAAPARPPKRADLHCHSEASNRTSEAVLNAIRCPESYSGPAEVYAQAKRRGMDFVTLTDHDALDGALQIADRPDVLVGEELTCWFPEDNCKMHVLVFGIDRETHEQLQAIAKDIYRVAEYIERRRLAHSVAHPIYRQNDKLERWHLERLLLLFKGFECLNGAHSPLHREAFEPVLDRLTAAEIQRLSETHGLDPRWPVPWVKSRTGGSDDHGLLNVGRTWTEFPADVTTTEHVLEALRTGRCRAGGEAGSSAKLAHTFYGIAVRYYGRHILAPDARPNFATSLLQTIVGECPAPTKAQLARLAVKSKLKKLRRAVTAPFGRAASSQSTNESSSEGSGVIKRLFLASARDRIREHGELFDAAAAGLPPLGEHEQMFEFVKAIDRDVTRGVADAIMASVDRASFTGLFDSIAAALAQQFVLLPYYFAVFHQNKERRLLRQITGRREPRDAGTLKVGLFTDTFGEVNGVARFIRDVGEQAQRCDRQLIVHTCAQEGPQNPRVATPGLSLRNFEPLLSRSMPFYGTLRLNLPPLLEILEWADRQQFDVIHCSTPGPMGLVGWVVSKMLRVPMLATYHTDFPAYVDRLTGDHRISNGTVEYMKWFYGQAATVFARSGSYRFKLLDLGVDENKLRLIEPGINLAKFNARHRSPGVWRELGVPEPRRLLYAGRVSVEKGLPLLAATFRKLCALRRDTALIVAGDGPYLQEMRRTLAGLPAYFLGTQSDEQLARLYASSDLFVFPSGTDTLGQAVMEAQACGLPALVSTEGGPREVVVDGGGVTIASTDPGVWCEHLDALLKDEPRRQHMVDAALARAARFDFAPSFEGFWSEHVAATLRETCTDETESASLVASSSSESPRLPAEVSPDARL